MGLRCKFVGYFSLEPYISPLPKHLDGQSGLSPSGCDTRRFRSLANPFVSITLVMSSTGIPGQTLSTQ